MCTQHSLADAIYQLHFSQTCGFFINIVILSYAWNKGTKLQTPTMLSLIHWVPINAPFENNILPKQYGYSIGITIANLLMI